MTDNCRGSGHRRHPLEIEQTEEQLTIDGLRRQIEELRASRERLALAADAERRDIERALHEGVQQDLVGLAANLEVAAGSVDTDPAAAKALLEELQREARRSVPRPHSATISRMSASGSLRTFTATDVPSGARSNTSSAQK